VDLEFCKKLEKAELHAHLHGSIRDSTLIDLMRERGDDEATLSQMRTELGEERTLSQCFKIFSMIHKLVTSCHHITRITEEVLEDFANDNVRYVELRSTPRNEPELGITSRSYIEAVIKGFKRVEKRGLRVVARLLLSINRAESYEKGLQTLELAIEYFNKGQYVVGIDFSGNPHKGKFKDFLPIFEKARQAGLKCAIHCGEIGDLEDTEDILRFGPDRIGHGIILTEKQKNAIRNGNCKAVPVEICPTSNLRILQMTKYDQHPTVRYWLENEHPFCICTDDFGVFQTTLSEEIFYVANAFNMTKEQVQRIVSGGFEFAFGCVRMRP